MLPWVPYPAIRRIQNIIRSDWRVLEMGSGNSTLWLARRVKQIRSVESDRHWHRRVEAGLVGLPAIIDYRLVDVERSPEEYWALSADEARAYDFVLVDGLFREECIRSALRAVRPGGYIYLDNVDTERAAFLILKEAVRKLDGAIELFTGFPPAQPTVTTGALARL
jgi:predicted O-methyltransferase YrrM